MAPELVPFFLSATYAILCPFNKVEESFNTQATHDVLIHGWNVAQYDHLAFPGVVPRTFIGAIALSLLSLPWALLTRWAGSPKIFLQLLVRITLAGAVCLSYSRLLQAVTKRLGRRTAVAMVYVVASTPHYLFYASRTLPNTFATLMVLQGVTEWILLDLHWSPAWATLWSPHHLFRSIAWLVSAIVWLRCDMVVLLAPIGIAWLLTGRATIPQLLFNGCLVGVCALAATVAVDSVLWRRVLWPEGEVLYFNAYLNRSDEYGVSPWHWYFSSALPRSMLTTLLFIPAGLVTLMPQATTRAARVAANRAKAAAAAMASSDGAHSNSAAGTMRGEGISGRSTATGDGGVSTGSSSAIQKPPTAAQRHVIARALRINIDAIPASSSSRNGSPVSVTPSLKSPPMTPISREIEEVFWSKTPPQSVLQLLGRVRLDAQVAQFALPGIVFICLYSFLPHKEVRFLLPCMPLLHIAAGRGLTKAYRVGEALLVGLRATHASPEAAAAELLADAVETMVEGAAPAFVAESIGSPRSKLRQRHTAAAGAAHGASAATSGGRASRHRSGSRSLSPGRRGAKQTSASAGAADADDHDVTTLVAADAPLPASAAHEDGGGLQQRLHSGNGRADGEPSRSSDGGGSSNSGGASPSRDSPSAKPAASPSLLRRALGLIVLAFVAMCIVFNTGVTAVFIRVSMDNYPGGEAQQRLYTIFAQELPGLDWAHQDRVPQQQQRRAANLLLPCPENDVTSTGITEWLRQCIDAKSGCPSMRDVPWDGAGATSSLMSWASPFAQPSDVLHRHKSPTPPGLCARAGDEALRPVRVHIDTATAVSGASRFGEAWGAGVTWVYSKREDLNASAHPEAFAEFDVLLTETPAAHTRLFDVWESIPSFVRMDWRNFRVIRRPKLFIMRRKTDDAGGAHRSRPKAQAAGDAGQGHTHPQYGHA